MSYATCSSNPVPLHTSMEFLAQGSLELVPLSESSSSHRYVLIRIPVHAYILTLLNQLLAKLNLILYLLKYLEHNVEKWRAVE